MFIASLVSPGALDPTTLEGLRAHWQGGDARWLSPREAAEFDLPVLPGDAGQRWQELQDQGIDLIVQPAAGRRKRLLIADMDSTMIAQECIDELADEAGVGAHVAAITARAMNGEIGFEGALRERVALLRGLEAGVIDRVLATRITLMPGGRELVATMKANGAHCALVSGGFTAFAGPIGARLGFHETRANVLLAEGGRLTGEVAEPILGREAKRDALAEIAAREGIALAEALAVGDGMNDLPMLLAAGTGVALHGKPALQERVRVRVNHADLSALLFLQGYARADFIS
ncbi:MAG: phosphoserine phosphatase SerB [Rubellimicrobium sp.]|nr:phosphoserine phosphatase SerB [Rubellimicrobium sp.]